MFAALHRVDKNHLNKERKYTRFTILFFCALFFILATVLSPNSNAQQTPPVVITCLGDSVTAGAGSGGPEYTYPAQMAVLLDSHYYALNIDVRNRGVGGDTADMLLGRLENENLMAGDDPDFVLLMIGGNDLNGGGNINETVDEVQQIVNWLNDNTNAEIIVSTFTPNLLYGTLGSWWISLFNNALQDQLSGYDLLITSNWNDLYDQGQGHAKTWLMADDVHPNADGYAIMAENWFDALCSFPSLMDSDNDGLFDNIEDSNGNGSWDEGEETNFNSADTDGDGFNDLVEVMCAGIPTALNPNAQPTSIKINFQPFRVATPDGYLLDGGHGFSAGTGYGW